MSRTKEQSRALTQPYTLCMQLVALVLLAALHPVLDLARRGLARYADRQTGRRGCLRRTGDLGYRRITLLMIGIAGAGLLLKLALA